MPPLGGVLLPVPFHPAAGVDESLHPRGDLVAVAAVGGIVGALPGEDGAFQVRHHSQVASVGRANARHVVVRSVGVGGIAAVVVFGHNVVRAFLLRQVELAFAVRHPNAELAACERAEHDGMVVGYGERDKLRLELVRIVVQHARLHVVVGCYQTQFHHELATVANAGLSVSGRA